MENEELLPKPELDLPLPEKELSSHSGSASQGLALRSYSKTNILKSKFFLVFVGLSFLIAFLIGGFVLGKNQTNKKSTSTVYQTPSPTPEAMANWKISDSDNPGWKKYTNMKNGYLIEYSADILIAEADACSFVKNDYLGLFKKRAGGKYSCGSDEPYYFYINSVDKKEITSNDSCYTVTKEATILDKLPAEKYTTNFHNNDKSCGERGIGPISKEVKSVYITHKAKLYLINWPILDVDETIYDQILSTFKFTN